MVEKCLLYCGNPVHAKVLTEQKYMGLVSVSADHICELFICGMLKDSNPVSMSSVIDFERTVTFVSTSAVVHSFSLLSFVLLSVFSSFPRCLLNCSSCPSLASGSAAWIFSWCCFCCIK